MKENKKDIEKATASTNKVKKETTRKKQVKEDKNKEELKQEKKPKKEETKVEKKEKDEQTKKEDIKVDKEKNKTTKEEPIIKEVIIEKKSGFNYLEVIVIMIITLILGSVIGSFITYIIHNTSSSSNTVVTEIPVELEEFVETYNNIVSDYYEEIDLGELLEAGIKGMLEYLGDDYSVYMDEEESETFNEQVEGKYTGIGVEIMQNSDGNVEITNVFENTPASEAGLQIGDIFYKVNNEDVTGLTASDLSSKIKGGDSEVKITVLRGNEEKEFTLTLTEVEIESVTSKTFESNGKKIGYINISIFASNSYTQFEEQLKELENSGIDSLIIDVRDNSGGYLSTVTDIASLFLDKSKVIYQLDTKGIVEQVYSKTSESRSYNIVVLINHNSASASEILASCLQESYNATVIGVNSYGKGTVQKAYSLESGATVKYTIQKWLTPNGNWINETGVTPDIEVSLTNDYYLNPSDDTDDQLQAAIEELSK